MIVKLRVELDRPSSGDTATDEGRTGADPRRRPVIWNAIGPSVADVAQLLDRTFHWDRLWHPLGHLTLLGLRHRLREYNLYDPGVPRHPGASAPADEDGAQGDAAPPGLTRAIDGRGTHPTQVAMGAVGTRFSRNAPVPPVRGGPDPALVSEQLLRRRSGEFAPAKSLNMLAAAWLQFEVHDWFAHQFQTDAPPLRPGVKPLKTDQDAPQSLPLYLSGQSHWWDASQLYGASPCFADAIRSEDSDTSGKVMVGPELLEVIEKFQTGATEELCADHPDDDAPTPVPNLWVGLALFHDIFAREHNAICDRLRDVYPWWTGQRVYDQARLINAAVMAKIHTVEWTPALLAHPVTERGIRATWWGWLGEGFRKRFGRVGTGEILSGIPGSWMDDDVPYALTEEFATVYRMHPLLPQDLTFHRLVDDSELDLGDGPKVAFEKLVVTKDDPSRVREQLGIIEYPNAWYSLAVAHPGALVPHNYPSFEAQPSAVGDADAAEDPRPGIDLGMVDILRTRECRIPRYNQFRRSLRMREAKSFLELANGDPQLAAEIKKTYDGKLEDVDLLVGLLAERKPEGFAISDTAFRVFLLMAARRLRSDRFFTKDYTPVAYTPLGLAWINEATMAGILRRHYPALAPALDGVPNVFKPWPRMPAAF